MTGNYSPNELSKISLKRICIVISYQYFLRKIGCFLVLCRRSSCKIFGLSSFLATIILRLGNLDKLVVGYSPESVVRVALTEWGKC